MKLKLQLILQPIVLAFLVLFDQLSKVWARNTLVGKPINLIPDVFSLTYLENRGSAFGVLQGRINFLLIITVIIFAIILYIYIKLPKVPKYMILSWVAVFMMAGAIGNAIDRIFIGYVTDFFYFELINFPIFNVADIYITVTAFLTIILVLTKYKNDDFQFLDIKKKNSEINSDEQSSTDN